ncbi:hypothetical protein D5086_008928 [Populus alba]|uniref:Uncharacterized protein n=1 Tax=Populus alba TaxID=43335 RepID=A0ACC4CIF3_POPAL
MFPPRSAVPLKPIPGSYGLPFFGAIKDRLDYFYNQGKDEFFSSRVEKYKSTVFKTNMPPGPFIAQNPRVIAVLDAISFPILFDTSKIEKFNVLDGTYLPSLSFTGGYRVYEVGSKRTANFNDPSDAMSFNFVFRLFCEKDPSETKLGSEGPAMVDKWVGLQLVPLATIGLPKFLKYFEDLLIHTFPIPFFLVKSDYKKLYDAFYASSSSFLDKAESFGIDRDEACHNLVFVAGFNAYGGMKAWFPTLINHDAAYEIKKGEMIFGYQPFATKDPKIFDHPEEFVGHRFVGEGENLLKYVYWSNGRETEDPTVGNKQCPGKDLMVLLSRLLVVELFLRYDTFTVETAVLPFGSSVTFTSLIKATST